MKNAELRQFLASRSACQPAMDWLGDRDSGQMWADCERPDWLLWWAAHAVPRQELVLAACDCAELALRFVPANEHRPRLAIETARRWATGEATVEEVRAARAAADDAADAAYAARAGARAAADAVAAAAAYAVAAAAAYAAADAAAYAARAAYHADEPFRAAYAALRAANVTYATVCQLIRQRWPECPLPEVAA
jgi:hypothetical protein